MKTPNTKKVAILATHGFEEVELTEPKKALEKEGMETYIISGEKQIVSWYHRNWNKKFTVDVLLNEAQAGEYDMLILPGGVINPDRLRRDRNAVNFVKAFFIDNKYVAAICHGPQMLIEADVINERTVTSTRAIKTDISNAGAIWVDQEVVIDKNLITSRNPNDLPAFNNAIISALTE